jgi:hypothetical protein
MRMMSGLLALVLGLVVFLIFFMVLAFTPVIVIGGVLPSWFGVTYTDDQKIKNGEIIRYFMIAGTVVGSLAGLIKTYRAYPVIGNSILATEYTHMPITTRVEDA